MFYLSYLYIFTYTCAQIDFHIKLCSFMVTITRRVPLVAHELL